MVDEINEKTDIVSLVSEYVKLEKQGKNYKGLCPFHEDTNPSFSVSPERNIAKCFSCNEGGAPIRFYQKINHIPFSQAVYELGKRLNIDIDFDSSADPDLEEHLALKEAAIFYHYYLTNSENGKKVQEQLLKRGITLKEIKAFQIGLAPHERQSIYQLLIKKEFSKSELEHAGLIKEHNNIISDVFINRIMFPITDERSRVVGFSARSIQDEKPKYINSSESMVFKKQEVLYNFDAAIKELKKTNTLIIHEGFFDVIASYQAGLNTSVAVMGTALTEKHIKAIIAHTKNVIIAYDGDNAGIEAAKKAAQLLMRHQVRVNILRIPDQMDPDDYLRKQGKEKYVGLYKNVLDPYRFTYETTKEGLNLKNANDISILKDTVKTMLMRASASTKEHYINLLSTDLGVSVYSLNALFGGVKVKEIPKKEQKVKVIPHKYYQAERLLFMEMLKSKENAIKIDQALNLNYVIDPNLLQLRTKYVEYIKKHDIFKVETFKNILKKEINKEELLDAFEGILKMIEYTQEGPLDDESLDKLIKGFKDINDEKRYREIKKKIKEEPDAYQKTKLIEELKELKKKIQEDK